MRYTLRYLLSTLHGGGDGNKQSNPSGRLAHYFVSIMQIPR